MRLYRCVIEGIVSNNKSPAVRTVINEAIIERVMFDEHKAAAA
jgi:hypothetical protein